MNLSISATAFIVNLAIVFDLIELPFPFFWLQTLCIKVLQLAQENLYRKRMSLQTILGQKTRINVFVELPFLHQHDGCSLHDNMIEGISCEKIQNSASVLLQLIKTLRQIFNDYKAFSYKALFRG